MKKLFFPILAALLLSACETEQSELQAWMDSERARVSPEITKVDRPKEFEPFRYESTSLVDPFSPAKMNAAAGESTAANTSRSGLQPDLNRRRETLESYPLDTIKMVGHIRRAGVDLVLLSIDKVVYTAKVGNYLGNNFGKITKINESEVLIKELVQDATGDWVVRETSLQLQDAAAAQIKN